jgi:peroxiredoxin
VRLALTCLALAGAACWHPTPRASETPADRYTAVGLRPDNAGDATMPTGLADHALAVGAHAPDATLRTPTDRWTLAGALAGHRRVVVFFYRGDWSSAGVHQLEALERALPGLTERGAALAAVSVDSPETGDHLVAGVGLTFPVASDPGHRMIDGFGVRDPATDTAWPSLFVVGAGGVVTWRWLGAGPESRLDPAALLATLDRLDGKPPPTTPPTPAPAAPRR